MNRSEPAITIQRDSREQRPLEITAYPVEVIGLPVGDYGLKGFSDWTNPAFIVERKSLDDLVGSLTRDRERFWRECEKLRQFGFRALLIEADRVDVEQHGYRSQATPQSLLASLDALAVRVNLHCFWCSTPTGAARQLEGLVRQFVRGVEKQFRALRLAEGEIAPLRASKPHSPSFLASPTGQEKAAA